MQTLAVLSRSSADLLADGVRLRRQTLLLPNGLRPPSPRGEMGKRA